MVTLPAHISVSCFCWGLFSEANCLHLQESSVPICERSVKKNLTFSRKKEGQGGYRTLSKVSRVSNNSSQLVECNSALIARVLREGLGLHKVGRTWVQALSTQPWESHHPYWVQSSQCDCFKAIHAPACNPSPRLCKWASFLSSPG